MNLHIYAKHTRILLEFLLIKKCIWLRIRSCFVWCLCVRSALQHCLSCFYCDLVEWNFETFMVRHYSQLSWNETPRTIIYNATYWIMLNKWSIIRNFPFCYLHEMKSFAFFFRSSHIYYRLSSSNFNCHHKTIVSEMFLKVKVPSKTSSFSRNFG